MYSDEQNEIVSSEALDIANDEPLLKNDDVASEQNINDEENDEIGSETVESDEADLDDQDDQDDESKHPEPYEVITHRPSQRDILKQTRYSQKGGMVLFGTLAALLFVASIVEGVLLHRFNYVTFFVGIFFAILPLASYSGSKKLAEDAYNKVSGAIFEYSFFDSCIEYRKYENNELRTFYKIDPKDITSVKEVDGLYIFVCDGIIHSIRKNLFSSTSRARREYFDKGSETKRAAVKQTLEGVHTLIDLSAIVILLIWYFVQRTLSPDSWYFILLFAPIPIALLAMMIIRRKAEGKIKGSHIIVTVCVIVLWLIIAGVGFLDNSQHEYNIEQSERVGQLSAIVGITVPASDDYETEVYNKYDSYTETDIEVDAIYVYLTKAQMHEFNDAMKENEIVWLAWLKDDMLDDFGFIIEDYHDSFFIYNVTEKTYNSAPKATGKCDYILVAYDSGVTSIDFLCFSK